ncbi:MAG: HD domain-containing protein [Candidatus Gracilibacteria bacterium]|jgi:hypothetical protein
MKNSITAQEARALLHQHLKQQYNVWHSLESEAILRALARHFGEDEDLWGCTALLHDLDWEEVQNDQTMHSKKTVEIIKAAGYDIPEMFHAILAHCEGLPGNEMKRETKLDFALAAGESVTGLIFAYVLMRPDKKVAGVEPSSINKKFKDKSFAAKVSREFIGDIEKTGLEKAQFFQIALDAVKLIANDIGM